MNQVQKLEAQSKRVRQLGSCCLNPDEPPKKKQVC